jgi:hypothetical protein
MDNHTHELVLRNGKQQMSLRWWIALAAVVMAGCATAGLGRPDKEIVAERAQERWNALVKSDFNRAYGYISPAGRELVNSEAYASSLKREFWTGAKVDGVECPTPDACEADVTIEYQRRGLKMTTPVREKWVKHRSNWWFVLER